MAKPRPRQPFTSLTRWQSVLLYVGITALILLVAVVCWSWITIGRWYPSVTEAKSGIRSIATLIVSTAGGLGGIIALFIFYHRQMSHGTNFNGNRERKASGLFQMALENFGSKEAQLRIAGIYELVEISDKYLEYQEKVLNILCGYLRLNTTNDAPVQDVILEQIRNHFLVGKNQIVYDRQLWCNLSVNLKRTIFQTEVDLSQAVFNNDVNLSGATFCESTSFAEATFNAAALFKNTIFEDEADFEKTTFHKGAPFDTVTFNGKVTFTGDSGVPAVNPGEFLD